MLPPLASSSPIPNGYGLEQVEEENEDHEEFADPANNFDFESLNDSTHNNPASSSMELSDPLGAPAGADADHLHRYDNPSSHLRDVPATPGQIPGGNQGSNTPQFVPQEAIQGTTSMLRSGDLYRDEKRNEFVRSARRSSVLRSHY